MKNLTLALSISVGWMAASIPETIQAAPRQAGVPQAIQQAQMEQSQTFINLRGGIGLANDSGRPVMCLQMGNISQISIEGCGNGSGILHRDSQPEIAHFRVKWSVQQWQHKENTIAFQAGLGFAELQVGADEPGFKFGAPTPGEPAVETAGPEVSASAQWSVPLDFDLEFIGDATFGAAWFEYAPALTRPRSPFAPFGEITFGIGW